MRILVAMSGGVDSSVAAKILKDQGHEVIGLHMVLHKEEITQCSTKRTCCSSLDANDAANVAAALGIQFELLPMYESFNQYVIENFISEYKAGRTPIPCTHCNGFLKFRQLFKIAEAMSCDYIATGHYIESRDGFLWASQNSIKDQSYFLWSIPSQNLSRLVFPIANYDKYNIRQMALHGHLPVALKSDSQDICFVPQGDYRTVLPKLDPYFEPRQGSIIHLTENIEIGTHLGHWNFTIGQRKGLPSFRKKIYVTKIEPETNTVFVGYENELYHDRFTITQPNFYNDFSLGFVKLNSASPFIPCSFRNNMVRLLQPAKITPGQAAVFYTQHGERFRLEGGGWIQ